MGTGNSFIVRASFGDINGAMGIEHGPILILHIIMELMGGLFTAEDCATVDTDFLADGTVHEKAFSLRNLIKIG